MRSLHVPMSCEEWERLAWRIGWKHEHWNGHAHLTPRQDHVLRSAYCVANTESALWHRAFGFEEEPDLNLARLRRAFYAHEVSRHGGSETDETRRERARLAPLYELWSRRTEELEEVAEREGFEAVVPSLRYGW